MKRAGLAHREARTPGYSGTGSGIFAAMLGDSTVRDFAIGSSLAMFARQWTRNQRNPFLNSDRALGIDSVFERLSRRIPVRAVEYACSGASVGPPRTWARRNFQWLANVRTLDGQIRQLLREPTFPDLILIWVGHNNLDFVTERRRFSSTGHLDQACSAIRSAFGERFRVDLASLVGRARATPRRSAIVAYGLVNPEATRLARDRARALRAVGRGRFPHLDKSEGRFPPLRPEHGDRLVQLSLALSLEIKRRVDEIGGAQRDAAHVHVSYSDATTRVDLCEPDHLHEQDAWHASEFGKRLIAEALFDGLGPALNFLET